MSQQTAIEWTDLSWNPVHGCSIVSTECRNCYAQTLSLRYGQTKKPWTPANAAENVLLKPHKLREPLSNTKDWRGLGAAAAAAMKTDGKLVFVNSTSDLFHEQVPFEFIDKVFEVMVAADRHTFQILTKRPHRMLAYFEHAADYMGLTLADLKPWPNIWLGVSVGLRHFVGRVDVLRKVPAAVRFISAEPLLGPLVYDGWGYQAMSWADGWTGGLPLNLRGIDWLIIGGESGTHHRPMDLQWARDLRDACLTLASVCARCNGYPLGARCPECGSDGKRPAFFMKQMGGARPGTSLDDLPEDLRIREFPAAVQAARDGGHGQ